MNRTAKSGIQTMNRTDRSDIQTMNRTDAKSGIKQWVELLDLIFKQ